MEKYNRGKVYKLVSDKSNLVYYGSTICKLSIRLAKHRYEYKACVNGKRHYVSSFEIIKLDDAKIILVEDFPCERKEQLLARERFYIENNDCVNKTIPGRTKEEYRATHKDEAKEYSKEWRDTNKDKKKEMDRIYKAKNKEKLKEQSKLYREKNKEKIRERDRLAYQKNKEKKINASKDWYQNNKDKKKDYDKKRNEKNKEQKKLYDKERYEKKIIIT